MKLCQRPQKYCSHQDHFRPACIYGKAGSRQPTHAVVGQGGTMADHACLHFYDVIHRTRDKRWSFWSHLCEVHGIAAFL